jgi:hypothetical protein
MYLISFYVAEKVKTFCERIKSNFIENINFPTHFAASWILPPVEATTLPSLATLLPVIGLN